MPLVRLAVFLAVVLSLAVATHRYLWMRLVRDPAWTSPWRRVATVAIVVLAVSMPTGLALWRVVGANLARPLSYVGATWSGVLLLFVFILVAADLLRATTWLARRIAGRPAPVDEGRRRLLARAFAAATGAGATGLSGVAFASAARPPEVVRIPIALAKLPPAFEGFRIVQLTDVHVGPILRREFLADLVTRTNALEPDVVAITGDLVDGSVDELRARHGVFFVTGNHEYYSGADAWLAHLPTLGVRPLRNERVELRRGFDVIDLAGIDDATAKGFGPPHGADLDRALADRDRRRPVILLAHQPKQVFDAERLGVDLQLSGHTHGGQIAPFGLFVRLVQPVVAGLGRFGPTTLYVSRGAGTWGPPMRLAYPAEITVIELTRAPA
jgi:hypothetical protein